jgi:hypothetical protein
VSGFVVGDITVANGSAGTFSTVSELVYTAVITTTATGTVTVDVAEGVCQDAAGNTNTAATQFSILYVAAKIWIDFSDLTTLFQDAARTTAITADGQFIHGVADKSGSGNHGSQAGADSITPVYKVNIQNGKSIARLAGANDFLAMSFAYTLTAETVFAVFNYAGAGDYMRVFTQSDAGNDFDTAGHYIPVIRNLGNNAFGSFADSNVRDAISIAQSTMAIFISTHSGAAITNRINGTGGTPYTHTLNKAFTRARIGATFAGNQGMNGDICEVIVFDSALSDAARNAIQSYLNTKWAVF